MGELESKTQFKVVTKDSYDALESGMKSNKETPIKLDKVRKDLKNWTVNSTNSRQHPEREPMLVCYKVRRASL